MSEHIPEQEPTPEEIIRVRAWLRKQQCEESGHLPNTPVGVTHQGAIGYFVCHCGALTWHPKETDA